MFQIVKPKCGRGWVTQPLRSHRAVSIFEGVYCAVQIAIQGDTVCEAARDVDVELHCRGQTWDFEENGFTIRR